MNKRSLMVIAVLMITCYSYAQDEVDEFQKEWGKDKRELVRLTMELSPADSVKFWPIYDQYEKQRQKLGKDRILILNDYVNKYESLTGAQADDIVNRLFKNETALNQLQHQYYGTFKAKLNPLVSARFLQIENYVNTTIRSLLQEELPFIGELERLKKDQ
jgi:hypothetical protein